MSKEPSKVLKEGLTAKNSSSSGKHNFSVNSDQTLKNTMEVKDLLRRQ